jgi:hypothetical protein
VSHLAEQSVNSIDHRMSVLINLGAVKKSMYFGGPYAVDFAINQADKNDLETNLFAPATSSLSIN